MARKQHFGIKFPFTKENNDEIFLDLNDDLVEKSKSDMLHLIFTPKGQRYRMPEFGTRLIDYIYSMNTEENWSAIKEEISVAVEKYVPTVTINDIELFINDENDQEVYINIKFTVSDGVKKTKELEISVRI